MVAIKTRLNKWLLRIGTAQPRTVHFWIITILIVFGVVSYYGCDIPLVKNSPFGQLYSAPHDMFRAIFLIPIIYTSFVYRVRGSIIVCIMFLAVVLPRALMDSPYPFALLRAVVFVIIASIVSLLVAIGANNIDKEKENTKLLQFLANCIGKQEGEKQHLAREIHDGSLQILLDISHGIDVLSEVEKNEDIKLRLKLLREKSDSVQTGLRQVITGLRPPLLEELGLESSLKWLAEEISAENKIDASFKVHGKVRRLDDSIELGFFRVAQEALQNAKKHSRASKINLELVFSQDTLSLTVRDNGVGFAIPAQTKLAVDNKFGLIGMYERIRIIGGDLRIESTRGRGTTIFAQAPINESDLNPAVNPANQEIQGIRARSK